MKISKSDPWGDPWGVPIFLFQNFKIRPLMSPLFQNRIFQKVDFDFVKGACRFCWDKKLLGFGRIRSRVAVTRVLSANQYTTEILTLAISMVAVE